MSGPTRVSAPYEMSTLKRAAVIQGRVVYALVLRDMLEDFGLSRLSLAWLILSPVITFCSLFLLFFFVRSLHPPQGMSLAVFIVTGFLAWRAFNVNFTDVPSVASKNGLLIFPHITVMDLILSRTVANTFLYTCLFVLFTALAILFSQAELPADPGRVLFVFFCLLYLGTLAGVFIAIIERFTNVLDLVWRAMRRLGVLVSGVMHPGTSVPTFLMPFFSWNPVFHGIELIREAWWPAYKSPFADLNYLLTILFFMTAIGLVLERGTRRWATR